MNTFVVSVVLSGTIDRIEENIEMIVANIGFADLDSVEIVIRNESEVVDG